MAIETLHSDYTEFAATEVGDDTQDAGFRIDDDSRADWALRKIKQAQANIERRRKFVDAEIARLERWLEQANGEDVRTIGFMTSHLRTYFDMLRDSGALGRRKSYVLPNGRIGVRSRGPQFVRDDNALLEWAVATGDEALVRRRVEPNWAEIRKRISVAADGRTVIDAATGEVVPGVTVAELDGETFTVQTEVDD